MLKPLCPWWRLQAIAEIEAARLAPDCQIVPSIEYDDHQVVWDEECEGIGRVSWRCGYFLPPGDEAASVFVPILNRAMGRWQARYDLGLTSS